MYVHLHATRCHHSPFIAFCVYSAWASSCNAVLGEITPQNWHWFALIAAHVVCLRIINHIQPTYCTKTLTDLRHWVIKAEILLHNRQLVLIWDAAFCKFSQSILKQLSFVTFNWYRKLNRYVLCYNQCYCP